MSFWRSWCQAFDVLATREKLLISLALLGGIWLLSWRFVLQPAWYGWQSSRIPIEQQQALFADLNSELTRLQHQLDETHLTT